RRRESIPGGLAAASLPQTLGYRALCRHLITFALLIGLVEAQVKGRILVCVVFEGLVHTQIIGSQLGGILTCVSTINHSTLKLRGRER
ncbi:hypothetical protein, partial [Erwinia billingiae]|uniref:hypothetical protein n=1 Tax=Erwinia billingiae TaxID=182337 RepID=UPI0019D1EA61